MAHLVQRSYKTDVALVVYLCQMVQVKVLQVSILGQSVVTWSGNTSVRLYKSNIQIIETKLRARHICDPSTIVF